MNFKKILLPLILLVLIVGAYFFLKKDTNSTLSADETNFAIENTESIDKIFMRSRFLDESAVLTKDKDGNWKINDKYDADMAKIGILLSAIKNISVKHPVGSDNWDNVIRNLASKGMKVEIYSGSKNLKTYYVGGPTPDHMGTYIWMENAEKPYVAHIEGFQGYLTPRFFTSEKDWRSRMIFTYEAKDIEWVKTEWTYAPEESFMINNEGEKPIFESELSGKGKINDNKLRSYLNYFDRLAFEGFPINVRTKEIDSIYNQTKPFVVITLKPKNKEAQVLQIHYKPLTKESKLQLDREGVQMPYDIDRYYAFFNGNSQELLSIQDYVFGKVMKQSSDFYLED